MQQHRQSGWSAGLRPATPRVAASSLAVILACAIVAVGGGHAATQRTAANGLVAAYSFDEGSGATVHDASGNGNDGTGANGTWTSSGKHGGALNFNGSSSMVTVPDSSSLDLASAVTIEAWVRPTSLGSVWRAVVVKEQPTDLVYALYADNSTSQPDGIVYSGGEQKVDGTSALPLSTWSHLAVAYDGSSLRYYVNGALAATKATSGAIATSNGSLRIGGDSVWGEWFAGRIDDVRIYSRALSTAEVQSDMNTAVGSAPAPPPPPADTTPPSTPGNLTAVPAQTSVALAWSASGDDVGVAGYGVYNGSTRVVQTAATTATVSGLTCGTSYTLGVDAYDAAGNRSAEATTTATTAACSGGGGGGSGGGGGGGGGTASVFLSPSGSDANACTQAAPCQSLARGYAVAAPGATVQLADGYYGCQTISGSKSSVVTFVPATGAVPKIDCQLSISATNLELDSMQIEGIRSTDLQNVTLRNVDVTCQDAAPYELWGGKCSAGLFLFNSVNGFTMIGGSVGPTWDDTYDNAPGQSQIGITLNDCSGCVVKNITLDGVHFHDNRRIDNQQHTSCLMLGGGNTVTIRNSSFTSCAVFDLFVTWWNFVSPQYPVGTNLLIENDSFAAAVAGCSGCTAGYFSVEFADYPSLWQNVTIRNNRAYQEMNFDGKHSSFAVTGNTMPQFGYSCKSDITYANNTVTGGKCGPTDILVSSLP